LAKWLGFYCLLMLFSKDALLRHFFGLLADKYPDIFKKEKQVHFPLKNIQIAFSVISKLYIFYKFLKFLWKWNV